jgi:hypothetical protein
MGACRGTARNEIAAPPHAAAAASDRVFADVARLLSTAQAGSGGG